MNMEASTERLGTQLDFPKNYWAMKGGRIPSEEELFCYVGGLRESIKMWHPWKLDKLMSWLHKHGEEKMDAMREKLSPFLKESHAPDIHKQKTWFETYQRVLRGFCYEEYERELIACTGVFKRYPGEERLWKHHDLQPEGYKNPTRPNEKSVEKMWDYFPGETDDEDYVSDDEEEDEASPARKLLWLKKTQTLISVQRAFCGFEDCWCATEDPGNRYDHGVAVEYWFHRKPKERLELMREKFKLSEVKQILTDAGYHIVMEACRFNHLAEVPKEFLRAKLDITQITAIRMASEEIYEGKADNKTFPICKEWLEKAQDKNDVPLARAFVEDLKKNMREDEDEFVDIPGGTKGGQNNCDCVRYAYAKPHRLIKYQQVPMSYTCMVDAVASAVHELSKNVKCKKLAIAAKQMSARGRQLRPNGKMPGKVYKIVEQELKACGYEVRSLKKTVCPWRIKGEFPVWVQTKSKKKRNPHCIAIYRNMIFDPSEERAMKMTRNNVDMICGGRGKYLGVKWIKGIRPVKL